MSERDAVLFANETFYAAFAQRDLSMMRDLWVEGEATTCIHPGWSGLHSTEVILETFEKIFEADSTAPTIECHGCEVTIYSTTAIVICYEIIDGTVLIATNIYLQHGKTWKIAHHHAGPVNMPVEDVDMDDDEDDENSDIN
jgi:hypothetical protein